MEDGVIVWYALGGRVFGGGEHLGGLCACTAELLDFGLSSKDSVVEGSQLITVLSNSTVWST